jgi:hypothetical protein
VQRDQDGPPPGGRACVHHGGNAVVVGLEDLLDPGRGLARVKISVARNFRDFAEPRHGAFDLGVAIAVDDQARIGLQHQGRVEQLRNPICHFGRPHVPRNVTPPIRFGDAECAQFSWN